MKNISKLLLLSAATCFAFLGSARAQLQTFETQTGYAGSVFTLETFGGTAGELFGGVSAIKSLTYNLFAGSANSNTSALTQLSATFGQWNGASFVNGTTINFGTTVVPASGGAGWSSNLSITNASFENYSLTFDFSSVSSPFTNATYGYLTNPNATYALMLTNLTGSTNLGLGFNFSSSFSNGIASPFNSGDWVFSNIALVPGNVNLSPVPESGTIAAITGAVLVAALVGFRLRQRRQLTLAPVAIA